MRPRITCHMVTSLDGRLCPDRWSDPAGGTISDLLARHYDATAARLGAGGWIVGRKTMADYVGEADVPRQLDAPRERPPFATPNDERDLAVAIDPSGRLAFESDAVDGDRAVVVLSERVPNDVVARLRDRGVSYVFAGPDGHDLTTAMDTIGALFGVRHLVLEGGGITNGAFLIAGLIDAFSTLIAPAIDGLSGVPSIFEAAGPPDSRPAAGQHLRLETCEMLDGGVVWLRHAIEHS